MYRVDTFNGNGGHKIKYFPTKKEAMSAAKEIYAVNPDHHIFILKEVYDGYYDVVDMYEGR